MMRSTLVLLGAAAAVVALAPSASAQTAPRVGSKAPVGAGYVVTPKTPKSVTMLVRVPRLTCTKSAVYSLATGMSGHVLISTKPKPWSLRVVASCRHGKASYKLDSTDSAQLHLRPGDRVRLLQTGPSEYEVDDVDTGEGEGGSSGGTGPQPTFARTMFFGTTVTGSAPVGVSVAVPQAHVNGVPIGRIAHRMQRQSIGAHAVAGPGKLGPTGAFTVAVTRK